jgi:hypothetical protein
MSPIPAAVALAAPTLLRAGLAAGGLAGGSLAGRAHFVPIDGPDDQADAALSGPKQPRKASELRRAVPTCPAA